MTDWWNSVLEEWQNIIQRRMSCCVERKSHKNGIAMELEKEEKKHSLIRRESILSFELATSAQKSRYI